MGKRFLKRREKKIEHIQKVINIKKNVFDKINFFFKNTENTNYITKLLLT